MWKMWKIQDIVTSFFEIYRDLMRSFLIPCWSFLPEVSFVPRGKSICPAQRWAAQRLHLGFGVTDRGDSSICGGCLEGRHWVQDHAAQQSMQTASWNSRATFCDMIYIYLHNVHDLVWFTWFTSYTVLQNLHESSQIIEVSRHVSPSIGRLTLWLLRLHWAWPLSSQQVISSRVKWCQFAVERWEMRLWPSNKNLCGFLCRIVPCLRTRNIEEHRGTSDQD